MRSVVAAIVLVVGVLEAQAAPTGQALPGLEPYDEFMTTLITAVAVLQLVQDGRPKLDDKVLAILGALGPRLEKIRDPRVHDITVRHLLQHSGGYPGASTARSGVEWYDPPTSPVALEESCHVQGSRPMSHYTLDQFLADTRATIASKGIPSGLAEIRDHLEKLLHNPQLLTKHLGDPVPYTTRTTIGHDPETDVHVLVHGREKAGSSSIHDHGPCWVIYGNYKNPTRMRRWRRLDDGSAPGYAEVELQKEFMNEPGRAAVFAVGDIHSIEFGDDTFFIRVTGGDVESKKTLKFDAEKKTVEVADRALNQR